MQTYEYNNKNNQFWQKHNKPIELWRNSVIEQRIDYIHNNPVVSVFFKKSKNWFSLKAKKINPFRYKGIHLKEILQFELSLVTLYFLIPNL